MKTPYYTAVRKGTFAGQPAADLQKFIEDYVRIVFPETEFAWWNVNERHGDKQHLSPRSTLPTVTCDVAGVHHFAVYVREGGESEIIEVGFVLRDGTLVNLMTGKTFDHRVTCWKIADAIETALRSIFAWEEIPEIVELAAKVPRKHSWGTEAAIFEPVCIEQGAHTLTVRTQGGTVLDLRDFSEKGDNARFSVQAYAEDWKRVLTNSKVELVEPAALAAAA